MLCAAAMLLCAANLLEHASLGLYGRQIRESVYRVLAEGKVTDYLMNTLNRKSVIRNKEGREGVLFSLRPRFVLHVILLSSFFQCCGSESIGSICFWASRIRIRIY